MTVKELIEKLSAIPSDTNVYAWHDGDVHELHGGIDTLDFDGTTAQININNSHNYS